MSKGEKKERDNSIFYIIIASIVIVCVLIGYPAVKKIRENQIAQEYRYNGFDFSKSSQGNLTTWKTVISSQGKLYQLEFYHHPDELVSIAVDPTIAAAFINPQTRPRKVYITLPDSQDGPTLVIAGVELSKILGYQLDMFNVDVKSALQTEPSNKTAEVSVVDCLQANANATVISFQEGDLNVASRDERNPYCIRLEYVSPRDAIKVADRIDYELLRIMS